MPGYPPPRRWRSDNIARVLFRSRVESMLSALRPMRSKSGPWLERDPDETEAWWQAVLRDPRSSRTHLERIPVNHPDASMRLDRCPASNVTVKCAACSVSAVYTLEDLQASFGADHSILRLPVYLLPCRSKRARREGECTLRAEPGGYTEHVQSVKAMRGA